MPTETATPPTPAATSGSQALWLAAAFVLMHLAAYRLSFVHPLQGLNITPWNPPAALSIVLLVWRPRWWWLAWLTLLGSDIAVRGSVWPTWGDAAATGAVVASHAAIARVLSGRLGRPPDIRTRQELLELFGIVVLGALLNALAFVGPLWLFESRFVVSEPLDAIGRYWIGDAVGLLVTLPLLFIAGHPRRLEEEGRMVRSGVWWLIAALAVALCLLVFSGWIETFKYFYLFFLPVVWAAARFGQCGASSAAMLVQIVLMAALQWTSVSDATVFEFQLLMAALACTALLLGVAVDERAAAARSLSASLRMAAAGDSAAAIAHELGQPLAALTAFAKAAQLLVRSGPGMAAGDWRSLAGAVEGTFSEAQRAGSIVQRLRGFVQDRTMVLTTADLGTIALGVVRAREPKAAALGVELGFEVTGPVPALWLDAVQIEVVVRNLLDNAIEAAARSQAPRWARVEIDGLGDQVRLLVLDSGPGVPPHRIPHIFDPHQASEKPQGMGIGLSLSRAIVEAHEGSLRVVAGGSGAFVMQLPVGSTEDDG